MRIWCSFPGVERPRREADHSSPSIAEVKECLALYLHPQYVFMTWYLVKHRDFLYKHVRRTNMYQKGNAIL